MLKTQITGAKYLSPQTNQMTNLNIAVPADSKDTKFGTSDIMLAKDVVAHYYTKEETDNQIQIAKNSAINIHNEDNTKSIKLDINDTEAEGDIGNSVNVSLTDSNDSGTININAMGGFSHRMENYYSYLNCFGMSTQNETYNVDISSDRVLINNNNTNSSINISAEKTDITIYDLNNISKAHLNSSNIRFIDYETNETQVQLGKSFNYWKYNNEISCAIWPTKYMFQLGGNLSTPRFSITAKDTTKGATITGVESITAFANPSATKVWATDGSTVDLTTKANTSDVLLKKSASGGYYIEQNSNELGQGAFAANSECTASGMFAHAEGAATASSSISHAEGTATASGIGSHAEGFETTASGTGSHAEGGQTVASGDASHAEGSGTIASNYSHAEGLGTIASGDASHAQGCYNIKNINAIHSVGIGNNTTRKNAEYIYAKNNESGYGLTDDPKNGYKYLIGVGGYDGVSTDNTTYKSVQEVIADLTSRIEQLETKVRALETANTPA